MNPVTQNAAFVSPALVPYGMACVFLIAHLQAIWLYSAVVRSKSGTSPNLEDTRGKTLSATDPPEVARVLRAHANGQASVLPFLFLGIVYVLVGGSGDFATWDFGIFAGARLLHSVAYLAGRQPWRTVFYATSVAASLALLGADVVRLVHASAP